MAILQHFHTPLVNNIQCGLNLHSACKTYTFPMQLTSRIFFFTQMSKIVPMPTEKPIHLSVQCNIPDVAQFRAPGLSMVSYRTLVRDMSSCVWVPPRMNTLPPSWETSPTFDNSHSEKALSEEKFHVKEFPVYQLLSIVFYTVTLHHWNVWLHLLCFHHQVFIHSDKLPGSTIL